MSGCAAVDCGVPEECGGTACAVAALPHDAGPDCDEWTDERCHAACTPEMHREYQGEAPHGGYVWFDEGDTCGPDCPRYEEDQHGDE